MTFGKYVRQRRKFLQKNQDQLPGFDRTYISGIETGRNHPTNRETITALAKALQLPKDKVNWLLAYSLFDEDPNKCIGISSGDIDQPLRLAEGASAADYGQSVRLNDEKRPAELGQPIRVTAGMTEKEIQRAFGPPDIIIDGAAIKWIYKELGVLLLFDQKGHVTQIANFTPQPGEQAVRFTMAHLKWLLQEFFSPEAIRRDMIADLSLPEEEAAPATAKILPNPSTVPGKI